MEGSHQWRVIRDEQCCMPQLYELPSKRQALELADHIRKQREGAGLPPFFAMITGPTLSHPYRMEDFGVSLGRHSFMRRDSDIHIGSHPSISHEHAFINFVRSESCYYITSNSDNGLRIKHALSACSWTELSSVGESAPLSNPAVIDICGILVYFEIFFLLEPLPPRKPRPPLQAALSNAATSFGGREAESSIAAEDDIEAAESVAASEEPLETPSAASASGTPGPRPPRMSRTFGEMIETALKALGGRAPQKAIADYIEEHFPEVLSRSTWRNSVSGTLSTNPLFAAEPVVLDSGKKARFNIWALRDPATAATAATAAAPTAASDASEDQPSDPTSPAMPEQVSSASATPMKRPGPSRPSAPKERMDLSKVAVLEDLYLSNQYPTHDVICELAARLDLPNDKVQNWFANRRKKQSLEEKAKGVPSSLRPHPKRKNLDS